jgi:hypothetical protein
MSGATSRHVVNRDNFRSENSRAQSFGVVNGVGEGPKRIGRRTLLWFSAKYLCGIL